MKLTDWHALVAVILAIGVASTLILLAANEFTHAGHVTADESTVIATITGAAVGAVATYLGMTNRSDEPDGDGERQLVTRWPTESRLKRPYDQEEPPLEPDPDQTAEYPTQP